MFPNRLKISTNSTDRLKYFKSKTGITPNILCRFAIVMAIKSSNGIENASVTDLNGQEFNAITLFGDNIDVYELLLKNFMIENAVKTDVNRCVASLIEIGLHKMGHIRSIVDLCLLLKINDSIDG